MFVVTQDVLGPALDLVRAGLVKNADPPIHSHILMELQQGKLRLAANCQVLHAQTSLPVAGGELALAVPGEIADIVNRLGGNIVFEARDQVLTVKSGGARLRLPCLGAREFPELVAHGATPEWTANAKDLLHALTFVEPAMARQETRPSLTGVLLQFGNGALTVVAFDGLAMAVVRMVADKPLAAKRILPAKTVAELIRVIKLQHCEHVQIAVGEQAVQFAIGNCELVSKVVDDQYPDWAAIMSPTANGGKGHRVMVARDRFLDAFDRVSLVARDEKRITLEYGDRHVVLSTTNGDQAAEEQVVAETAEAGKLVLNKAKLRAAVASLSGEKLTLAIAGSDKPVRLAGDKRTEYYVVMPMKT